MTKSNGLFVGSVTLALVVALVASFLISESTVQAVPQPPHQFFGRVFVGTSHGNSVPLGPGFQVEAKIGGTDFAQGNVFTTGSGEYGPASNSFQVSADDPTTALKEGGVDGDVIQFSVEGVPATARNPISPTDFLDDGAVVSPIIFERAIKSYIDLFIPFAPVRTPTPTVTPTPLVPVTVLPALSPTVVPTPTIDIVSATEVPPDVAAEEFRRRFEEDPDQAIEDLRDVIIADPEAAARTLLEIARQNDEEAGSIVLALQNLDPEAAARAVREAAEEDPAALARVLNEVAKKDAGAAATVLNIAAKQNENIGALLLIEASKDDTDAAGNLIVEAGKQDRDLIGNLVLIAGKSDPDATANVIADAASKDPRVTGQVIANAAARDPATTGNIVADSADRNPGATGRALASSARENSSATGDIVCVAIGRKPGPIGSALGSSAEADPAATGNALVGPAQNRDCLRQLGSVIPVGPWVPEDEPQEGDDSTGDGVWQGVGSPAPIDKILARYAAGIVGAHTNISDVLTLPANVPELPAGRINFEYLNIEAENFTNDDLIAAHVTMFVDKQWLRSNQVHEWSMQFSRYVEDTNTWIPAQAKRLREDADKVFYSVTVPGFSLWAIHGSTEAPSVTFIENNLRMNPPAIVQGGQSVISVDVTNQTAEPATYFANLWVNRQINQTDQVVIGAGATITIDFLLTLNNSGTYDIRVGRELSEQPLFVQIPTATPTATIPAIPTATATATPTPTPAATGIATFTPIPTPTRLPPTSTPGPVFTPTPTPTVVPTFAVPPTRTPRPPSTPLSTATTRPTSTPVPTNTPRPTATPVPPTSTAVPTATPPPVVTVVPPGPTIGDIGVSDPNPTPGDDVVITIPITNPGTTPIDVDLEVEVDGTVVDRRTVTVPPGDTVTVRVTITAPDDPTTVVVRVDNQTATARLTPTPPRGIGLIIGIIIGLLATVIMVGIVMVVYLRRRVVAAT